MHTIPSHAPSGATSALTSLSSSDDGDDVEMVDGEGGSARDIHATDSSANWFSSDVVSEPSSLSYKPSGSSEAGSTVLSDHWLEVVSTSGIKRNVRMKACLDYKALRNTPIEEGQAFGAFLEDLHKKNEELLKFYIKFDGEVR
jgi:hypothetical protein